MTPDLNTQNLTLNCIPQHDDPLNMNLRTLAETAAVIPGHRVIEQGSDTVFWV
jgi:hypothetical protein